MRDMETMAKPNATATFNLPAGCSAGESRPRAHTDAQRPLVDFMIVGAQKCGTTALSEFLRNHPEIGMSQPKGIHLFDRKEYDDAWTVREIDAKYAEAFAHCPSVSIRGEATPSYLYLPEVAARLRRYNPVLKLIVLLRDPVDRAVSQYRMNITVRFREREHWPFWLALLLEPFQLRRGRYLGLPRLRRQFSYRGRGLYSAQLRNLYRHFPRNQVLVVWSENLRERHDATMGRILRFLGVSGDVCIPGKISGGKSRKRYRVTRAILRVAYRTEPAKLRRLLGDQWKLDR